VSIPNNVTATTFNGVARTTTWKIKSNNAVEIGFSGHSPVDDTSPITEFYVRFDPGNPDSYENIDPDIPLFYKQEVNARGELIAGEYDYLQTRFGVLITDHDSTEHSVIRHLSNLNIFESGGYPDLYHLIEDLSEDEKNQVKGDAGYNKYGYMETISKASELTAQDRSGYYSSNNSNRYDQYKATTNGDYFDVNSSFSKNSTVTGIHTYSTGDKILTDDGYKIADTTENYEACTSYQPDPLSETGALICTDYETLTRSVERRIDEGVTTQNGTYNAVSFTLNDDMTEAGKTQLYRDLTFNEYGITLWNENMKNSDYSHSNSEVSNKQRSYYIWPLSQEPKVVPNATPDELVHIAHIIGFFGDIMPNTEGNFNLALYSVGTVDKPGTQSGLYSMTVVLNVAAKEKY
jgi:hypothetical protein